MIDFENSIVGRILSKKEGFEIDDYDKTPAGIVLDWKSAISQAQAILAGANQGILGVIEEIACEPCKIEFRRADFMIAANGLVTPPW